MAPAYFFRRLNGKGPRLRQWPLRGPKKQSHMRGAHGLSPQFGQIAKSIRGKRLFSVKGQDRANQDRRNNSDRAKRRKSSPSRESLRNLLRALGSFVGDLPGREFFIFEDHCVPVFSGSRAIAFRSAMSATDCPRLRPFRQRSLNLA